MTAPSALPKCESYFPEWAYRFSGPEESLRICRTHQRSVDDCLAEKDTRIRELEGLVEEMMEDQFFHVAPREDCQWCVRAKAALSRSEKEGT